MQGRTRRKHNIIYFVASLLALVFISTIGITFAATTFNSTFTSNKYSTKAYLSHNSFNLINDSLSTPIPFGLDGRNYQISLQYTTVYDVEVCFRYQLSWSNEASTDNVILNFSDRDNFIVDDQYIYYVGPKLNGVNKTLIVITGVDFADPFDSNYVGATLTISMSYETSSNTTYNTSHPLYHSGLAGTAWLKTKNRESGAYAIVYNYTSKTANALRHPTVLTNGAYRRNADSNDSWIGGEKEFAGMYAYVVVGTSAITLTASVSGAWVQSDGTTPSGSMVFTNNIYFNFADGWEFVGYKVAGSTPVYNYQKTIPANTNAYIPIVDSAEITCQGLLLDSNLSNYTPYYAWGILTLNNVTINNINSGANHFTNMYCGIQLASSGVTTSGSYTKPTITISNASKYNAALYKLYGNGTAVTSVGAVSQYANIALTNNTNEDKSVSVTSGLKAYVSNGQRASSILLDDTSLLLNKPNNFATSYQHCFYKQNEMFYPCTSSLWDNTKSYYSHSARYVELTSQPEDWATAYGSYYTLSGNAYVANTQSAWETANATGVYGYYITSAFKSTVWAREEVSVDKTYVSSVVSKGTTVSGVTTITIPAYATRTVYVAYEVASNLFDEYKGTLGVYGGSNLTSCSEAWVEFAPTISASSATTATVLEIEGTKSGTNVEIRAKNSTNHPMTLSSVHVAVQTRDSAGNITILQEKDESLANVVLMPNESCLVKTYTYAGSDMLLFYASSANGVATSITGPQLVNEGTLNAYLINTTARGCYVKFTGELQAQQQNVATINSSGVANYYLGILRPNQIVPVPMSVTGTLTSIVDTGVYEPNSTVNSWGSSVSAVFNKLFEN